MTVHTFHFSGEPAHHPDEDARAWRDNRFAVFDGITLLHQQPYPDPSPAAAAAQAGCQAVLDTPLDAQGPEKTLRHMAAEANRHIKQLNQFLNITEQTVDYLAVQYAAAVGAYGFIQDDTLHCAQLNDCEVMVLNKQGDITFRLETDTGPVNAYLRHLQDTHHFAASSPEEHQYARKNVINNTQLEFQGVPIRMGVFTGQEVAEQFITIGQHQLAPGDTVLFYSDGMLPFVDNPAFRKYLATAADFKDLDSFHRSLGGRLAERSLVLVRPG
ncbi:MAG TPA: hypothetical protein VK694_02000 [Verrucomicrobiae bacterium]|nr:hypothetical protein [Verrucomicrobiae bacterium]